MVSVDVKHHVYLLTQVTHGAGVVGDKRDRTFDTFGFSGEEGCGGVVECRGGGSGGVGRGVFI